MIGVHQPFSNKSNSYTYSLILSSFETTTLSFDPPRARAIIIIKTIIAPTTHIQGWIAVEEVVVVVVELEDEAELSCPNTISCIKMSVTIVITDR